MVAIHHHLVPGYVGDGVDQGFARILALALELHADRDVRRKFVARLDLHQLGVIFTEGFVRVLALIEY